MLRLSTSSWSLDHTLGSPRYADAPGADGDTVNTSDADLPATAINLLELPQRLADHGLTTLELCHFHLPSRRPAYLRELRAALSAARVELFSVLIDAGDISQRDEADREKDVLWTEGWLATAGELGATHARVASGDAPPSGEVIARVATELRRLGDFGRAHGVKVITENFRATSREPAALIEILKRCEGRVGLCVDFGNAEGDDKYDILATLLPLATSVHAKARTDAGRIDHEEFRRCVRMAVTESFDGPMSLINSLREREWTELVELRDNALAAAGDLPANR